MVDNRPANNMIRHKIQSSNCLGLEGNSSKMPSIIILFFYLFASTFLISQTLATQLDTSNERMKIPDAETASAKGYQLLLGSDKDSVAKNPAFFKSYGTLGVNYDIDRGQPFIWCERMNSTCTGPQDQCITNVKCYPERRSHLLGCMAVFVYNVSEVDPHDGHIIPPSSSMLKGCWSHYDSELQECLHDTKCISHTRSTGTVGRTAQFCCCRTHHCNQNVTLQVKIEDTHQELSVETTTPTFVIAEDYHLMPKFLIGSTIFLLVSVLIFALCVGITSIFSFWLVRRKRRHTEDMGMKEMELLNKGGSYMEITSECEALLGAKAINLKNPKLCELLSAGQFSEVYRAEVDNISVAIRIYNIAESDGWVNEQEIYAIKNLRTHDNIVNFLGSIRHDKHYWFITKYYLNGSVYDYLENNKPTIHEACKLLSSMLSGLAFLHEEFYMNKELKPSIVHRDFKSKNVLIKSDLTACISDFGFAVKCENGRMANEDNQSQVGTRRYMSPEVLEGATEFSGFAFQQIDVYAASLVIWEILSRTRVPEDLDEMISEYMLPYEREIGKNPTLGRLRELVVIRKFRPLCRESLFGNPILIKVIKTMRDMWDGEPDGRITSSCARDRMNHYYNSCIGNCPLNEPVVNYHDVASVNSSTCSVQTGSAVSSFDCPSTTKTTLPISQANGSSSHDRLTSSTSSSFMD